MGIPRIKSGVNPSYAIADCCISPRLAQLAHHARRFRHHEGNIAVRRQKARALAYELHLASKIAVAANAAARPNASASLIDFPMSVAAYLAGT